MSLKATRSLDPALPELGIGITYCPQIVPLLQDNPGLADVIEVEPQTTWIETRQGPDPYLVSESVLEHLASLPGRKLVHSVGTPVGGTVRPQPAQLSLLCHAVDRLDSPWFSDHLSFNATPEFSTGFFLPPRQTEEGITTVVQAIADLQAAIPVPIAVETGVNYLRPRSDEIADGLFTAAVVEAAGCGLLLDLHNIFANALNGRQQVDEFLGQVPLDRVWEIHLAGGFEMDGFWLDAHSGAIPDHLLAIARRVIPALPNLKAIIFEIFPSFLPAVGMETVRQQLEILHDLWDLRGETPGTPLPPQPAGREAPAYVNNGLPPSAWEEALGELVIGRAPGSDLANELSDDPGVELVNKLICEFRASMVVSVLRLTSRFMMLALGTDVFRAILEDFWRSHPPQLFAGTEADVFADYLVALDLKLPHLSEVLAFEQAVLATLVDDQSRVVTFDFDPLPLFRALAEGRLPEQPGQPGLFEIEVTADGPVSANGLDLETVSQVFPFH